jgi:hypothetical protein
MYSNTRKTIDESFNRVEKGQFGNYLPKEGRMPKVTNEDYLKKVKFVLWRTQASFDLPCSICGSFENVQMHHLRHIRKRSYALIPGDKSYEQVMSLRNRKQIPVCAYCHREVIHKGEYSGPK